MKRLKSVLIAGLLLLADVAIAQPVKLQFTPASFLSGVYYNILDFPGGEKGIEFSLILKPGINFPDLRPGSIIFKSAAGSVISYTPATDTILNLPNGSISISVVHKLQSVQVNFLKQQQIQSLIFIIGKDPLTIQLKKQSGKKLLKLAGSRL